MSDLYDLRSKVQQGINWRGDITVTMDGEQHDLAIRQLRDSEFWDVMSRIDRSELEQLQEQLPQDIVDEYDELQEKDELDADEQDRLEELQQRLEEEGPDYFEVMSDETFYGIQECAKYCAVPDDEDVSAVLRDENLLRQFKADYPELTEPVQREDIEEVLTKDIERMIDNATQFVSFTIGIQALVESVEELGN